MFFFLSSSKIIDYHRCPGHFIYYRANNYIHWVVSRIIYLMETLIINSFYDQNSLSNHGEKSWVYYFKMGSNDWWCQISSIWPGRMKMILITHDVLAWIDEKSQSGITSYFVLKELKPEIGHPNLGVESQSCIRADSHCFNMLDLILSCYYLLTVHAK